MDTMLLLSSQECYAFGYVVFYVSRGMLLLVVWVFSWLRGVLVEVALALGASWDYMITKKTLSIAKSYIPLTGHHNL